MKSVSVILAAGGSSRMGRPKALLQWGGRSFLECMVATLRRAHRQDIAVVVGAHAADVAPAAERVGLRVLSNANWATGRMSSVRIAARHAAESGSSLLLWPIDCPAVSASTIDALVDVARRHPLANIVPSHLRRGGHPVLLSGATCCALSSAPWKSLREAMLGCDAERRFVEVPDAAILENVDTPEDLATFLAARAGEAAHA